jgi:hypothetical protein
VGDLVGCGGGKEETAIILHVSCCV